MFHTRFSTVIGVLFAIYSTAVSAQVPHLIRYQGQAVDSKGVPLKDNHNLTFRIYDADERGNKLWEETQNGIPLTNGYFSVLLGQVKSLNEFDWNKSLWLSAQVDTNPELSPRQRLTSVPYAIVAEQLRGGVYTTEDGKVGIGTTKPGATLHIVGNQVITKAINFRQEATPDYTDGNIQAYGQNVLQIKANSGGSDGVVFLEPSVGVGTTNTQGYRLYVNGSAYATGGFTGSSRMMKTEIQPLALSEYPELLDQLASMEVVRFRWKEGMKMDHRTHLGIIAEEAPVEITNEDKTAIGTSEYLAFLAASVKAVKGECDILKGECKGLKAENDALKKRVEKLEREDKNNLERQNTPLFF